MVKLDIVNVHARLLAIAKVVNSICEHNNIPLYMVGGTMLGAIRHKGFIPWDDDMDFAVTYDNYVRLKDILEKELLEPYHLVTFENNKAVRSFFMKVEDTTTVIDDPRIALPIDQQLGLNIDIFPLVSCFEDGLKQHRSKILRLLNICRLYVESTKGGLYKHIIKKGLRFIVPYDHVYYLRKVKKEIEKIRPGDWYFNVVSPHFHNVLLPKSYLTPLLKYEFEDTCFYGIVDYDSYLKSLYKNYMQLPPKDKRIVHVDNVYLRE